MISRLSNEEARGLLTACSAGRLGCVYDGGPYVVPVNYVCHGDGVFIHSLPGRKIDALRANPKACLQVDQISDAYHTRSRFANEVIMRRLRNRANGIGPFALCRNVFRT